MTVSAAVTVDKDWHSLHNCMIGSHSSHRACILYAICATKAPVGGVQQQRQQGLLCIRIYIILACYCKR